MDVVGVVTPLVRGIVDGGCGVSSNQGGGGTIESPVDMFVSSRDGETCMGGMGSSSAEDAGGGNSGCTSTGGVTGCCVDGVSRVTGRGGDHDCANFRLRCDTIDDSGGSTQRHDDVDKCAK